MCRKTIGLTLLAFVVIAAVAYAAAPTATVDDVTQTSIKLGSLKCGTTYNIRVRTNTNGTLSETQTINQATSACPADKPATVDFTVAPASPVKGQAATFTATAGGDPPFTYRWTDPDDNQVYQSTTDTLAYTFNGLGAHRMAVTATDSDGDTATATHTFNVVAASPDPNPNPPPAGNSCMADPSVCGYPDIETTGVQPGTTLTPSSSVTLNAGQTLENKLVTGGITVNGPNVTIRNVKLVVTDDYYGIRAFWWQVDTTGLSLDHVEIDLNGHSDIKGIAFGPYTMRHSLIHNGSDCAHFEQAVTLEDNLCAVGPDANDDGWPDGGPTSSFCNGTDHFDGFQTDGTTGPTVIRHNTIRNPCGQTSAILLSSNTSHVSNTTITDNLMAGGGWTLYCMGTPSQSSVDHITVTGNRVSKTYYDGTNGEPQTNPGGGGYWGPWVYCANNPNVTASGNVWDDDGTPLPAN